MLSFRQAERKDLDCLVQMLFDDPLGKLREDRQMPLNPEYLSAFEAIRNDDNNELIIVEDQGEVLGMLQLTFIPYLTHIGSWRCLIEGVRVHKAHRGKGLGTQFFKMGDWASEAKKM